MQADRQHNQSLFLPGLALVVAFTLAAGWIWGSGSKQVNAGARRGGLPPASQQRARVDSSRPYDFANTSWILPTAAQVEPVCELPPPPQNRGLEYAISDS